MKIKIQIPTPLRVYTDNNKNIELEASTVAEALDELIAKYSRLQPHLYEKDKIRSYVNIYLNDEDIRFINSKLDTIISEGDVISIIPSIAGGML